MDNFILSEAVCEVFEPQLNSYLDTINTELQHEFSISYQKKMAKLIKRRKKPYFHLICTSGRRVACIITAIVVLSLSSLTVKAVRDAIKKLFMKELNDHVEVMIESIDDNLELIQDEYVITDIPEGFEMTYYNSDECSIDYNYQKGNYSIKFLQAPVDIFNINLDNEHSEIEHSIDSDGQEYIIRTSSDSCTYVWSNGEYAFQIYSNLNKNEVLELCRSTKIKK